MTRLEEIIDREKKATPGPWESSDDDRYVLGIFCDCCAPEQGNVVFIAHARQDIPYLIARVKRLEEALRDIGSDGGDAALSIFVKNALKDEA